MKEGSIPTISSPRRSNLAFVRVGSAVCGNSELKVRHKYGAKRVFKLMIRADFSLILCCLFYFFLSRGVGGRGLAREDPPVHLCRAVCTYTAPGRGVEARQGTGASEEDEEERALCFIFEGRGRCETGLQSLLTHRLEIEQTFFLFLYFIFFLNPRFSSCSSSRAAGTGEENSRILTPRLGLLFAKCDTLSCERYVVRTTQPVTP